MKKDYLLSILNYSLFSAEKIVSLKVEFMNSLAEEFENIQLYKNFKSDWETTYLKYTVNHSFAGIETFMNAFNERLYFLDIEEELYNTPKDKKSIEEFHTKITDIIRADFSDEDYRFIDWERTPPNTHRLNLIIKKFIKEQEKILNKYQKNYLPGYYLSTYKESLENPSTAGLKVKWKIVKTPKEKIDQFNEADTLLKQIWPEGYKLYSLITNTIHIVKSKDLVSYSHFTEFGVSYINLIDRNLLETIDDLIHENSHHHLNLLLKKFKLFKSDDFSKVFYSPWRKELRNLYAIFHATFTFSFGSMLFYKIVASQIFLNHKKYHQFHSKAIFRFLEETQMVNYSLNDLKKYSFQFTKKGNEIIKILDKWNQYCNEIYELYLKQLNSKEYIQSIQKLENELKSMRIKYSNFEEPHTIQ
jgi:hypothetical protein